METSVGKRWDDGKIRGIVGGSPDVKEEDWLGRRSRKTNPRKQHVGVDQLGKRRQGLTDRKEIV